MTEATRKNLVQRVKELVFEPGEFTGQSGIRLNGYFEITNLLADQGLLKELIYPLGSLIPEESTCIAAPAVGDAVLAEAIALTYNLPLTFIRKELKKNSDSYLEGYIPTPEDKTAVFTDVCTTGGSARYTIKKLHPTGAEIIGYFTIVKRGEPGISPFYYLFEEDEFLD